MTRFSARTALILTLAMLLPGSLAAQETGERLQIVAPEGFVEYRSSGVNGTALIEFVPDGQTTEDWTQKVSLQFLPSIQEPVAFTDAVSQSVMQACASAEVAQISQPTEAGHATSLILVGCPLSPATGKPEYFLMKAIAGHDRLYVVQMAWAGPRPTPDGVTTWSVWLRRVVACDEGSTEAACAGG